jgi:two-component system sensor histidine kinase/response regulator
MPELDGYEASRQVRLGDQGVLNPQVPIIAMTASDSPGERERCLAAGMNDYVCKPVGAGQLAAVIENWTMHALPDLGQEPPPPESQQAA